MIKLHSTAAAAALLANLAATAFAQTPPATQLAPAAARISDTAIQADHHAYEARQGRIKGLHDRGRAGREHHPNKAKG